MKKILLGLLLIVVIRFDIHGESYTIPLTYQVSPTYIVSVPKVIDISNNETSFCFNVSGDIYYDYQLEVLFNNVATITNGTKSVDVYVTQDKSLFNYDEIVSRCNGTVYLNHGSLSSGTYSGTLNFTITLKEGAYSQWKIQPFY